MALDGVHSSPFAPHETVLEPRLRFAKARSPHFDSLLESKWTPLDAFRTAVRNTMDPNPEVNV
jgi:hypothetical protein